MRALLIVFLLSFTLISYVGGGRVESVWAQDVAKVGEFRLYPSCKTPQNKIEEAVCSTEGARRVHQEVARAYVRLYRLMEPSEQRALESEHFAWLDSMYEACSGNLFNEQGASALLDQLAASMRTDCVIFRGQARREDMQSAYGSETFLERLSERLVRKHKNDAKDPTSESPAKTVDEQPKSNATSLQVMKGDLSEEEETQALLGEAERLVRLIEEEQTREISASDPNSRDSLSQDVEEASESQTVSSANIQTAPLELEKVKSSTRKPETQTPKLLEQPPSIASPDFSDSASVIRAMAGLGRDLYQLSNRNPSPDVRAALRICLEQLKRINDLQLKGYDWRLAQESWENCTVLAKKIEGLRQAQ